MEVEIDESAWPIVVARWRRGLPEGDLAPILRRMDQWLARGRFGLMIDARGASGMSPDQRAQLLEHMKANAVLTAERLVQAVVLDNLVHRTLFYGVNLLLPAPFPNKVFSEPESARLWLEAQLTVRTPPGRGG